MRITTAQTQALATFIARIRDDWDHPGIVAAITKAAPLGTPADIGTALCRLAANRDLRTPAMLADQGSHWTDTTVAKLTPPVTCPDHPTEKAGACRVCEAQAVPAERAAELGLWQRPTLSRRKAVVRREPKPTDLADVRARADAEEAAK